MSRSFHFVLLGLLLWANLSHGFLQELILSEKVDETGNIFIFRSSVADTVLHSLGNIQRYCSRGIWVFFDEPNFLGRSTTHQGFEDNLYCSNFTFDYRSFRHLGFIETSQDSLSLYSETNFHGEEMVVTESITAHISSHIKSLSLTGPSNWTLFEGNYFNGTSICRLGATEGQSIEYQYTLDLETVGSVLKGCGFL